MKCKDVQDRLTDYMSRELGTYVSEGIRVHLTGCKECSRVADELAQTMDVLRRADPERVAPTRLSVDHRKRITRSYAHPVLHWLETHHVAISLIAAAIVLICAWTVLEVSRSEPGEVDTSGVEIWVGEQVPSAPAAETGETQRVAAEADPERP